ARQPRDPEELSVVRPPLSAPRPRLIAMRPLGVADLSRDCRRNGMRESAVQKPLYTLALVAFSSVLALVSQVGAASAADTTDPQVWQWKTWAIGSPERFRVAAPPDAAATAAETAKLKDMVAERTPAALDTIAYWTIAGPSYRWSEIAVGEALQRGLHTLMAYRDLALLDAAIYDAIVAAWDNKHAYNRPRPSSFESTLTTAVPTPKGPSYPSEEAAAAGAAAAVLASLFPDRADFFAQKADEAAHAL